MNRLRDLGSSPRLAAVLGAVAISFSGIFYRFSGTSPSTATAFRCAYALPFLGLLMRHEDRQSGGRSRHERLISAGAGVFFASDLVLWSHSVQQVGAGLATVLANMSVVVVGLAGWVLLGERPSTRTFAGLPLVLLGAVLISGAFDRSAYGANPALGVVFGLGAAVCYAGYLLVIRRGNRDGRHPFGSLFDASWAAALTAVGLGLLGGDLDLVPSLPAHAWLFIVAITSQVVGYGLINVSLPRLPVVVTSIILLLQPVTTIVFAWLLLAEAPSPIQLGGVVLVMSGVVVAAGGRRSRGPATATTDLGSDGPAGERELAEPAVL